MESSVKEYKERRLNFDSGRYSGERLHRLRQWVTFYRKRPDVFIKHYFGVELYEYQKMFIYILNKSMNFTGLASRATSKSFIVCLYAIVRCVLFPGSTIVITAATKKQASLIISEKGQYFYDNYPMIRREISSITKNLNTVEMVFKNSSKMIAVPSTENSRGLRATTIIIDESVLLDNHEESIIDSVFGPMLYIRTPSYLFKEEYKDIPPEEPQTVRISSVKFKNQNWHKLAMKHLKMMAMGDENLGAIFLDYITTLRHKIKSPTLIRTEKNKIDDVSWSLEYENLALGTNEKSFYNVNHFIRNIRMPFIPWRIEFGKTNPYKIKRQSGEIRLVASDFALRGGRKNDLTILSLIRLIPLQGKGYKREVVYIESHSGKNSILQVLRLKQLFFEFCDPIEYPSDTLVIDGKALGVALFDIISSKTEDAERGLEYPALTIRVGLEDNLSSSVLEDFENRTLAIDAIPCVYPIIGSSTLNSDISIEFRDKLKRGLVSFVVEESILEETFINSGNKDILDSSLRAYMLAPAIQTNFLINEAISLSMNLSGMVLKLEETGTNRKDRVSSVSYGSYYASLLDNELLKESDNTDILEELEGAFFIT